MDAQRDLLDQLMGKNRDLTYQEQIKRQESYSDDKVCKNMLVSVCFNDLFPKTSYDEGQCKKRHDPIFKHQFENDDSYKRFKCERKYIGDSMFYIEEKLRDVDGKIKSKQVNLDKTGEGSSEQKPKEIVEKVEQLEEQIRNLLEESGKLGEEGQLEESEKKANEAEHLAKVKEETIKQGESMTLGPIKEQEVCQICGAYQAISEHDKRKAIHLEGKIHQGFKFFREEIERLKTRKIVVKEKENELKRKERSRSRDRKSKKSKHSKHSRRRHSSSSSSERDRKKKKKKHSSKHRRHSSSRSRSR